MSSGRELLFRLAPVYGAGLREQEGAVILVLAPVFVQKGTTLPEGPIVAIVHPVPGSRPARQMWDIKIGDRSLIFEARGTIDLEHDDICEPVDFGQVMNARGNIETPLQFFDPVGAIEGFEASLTIRRNNQAVGFIDVYITPERAPRTYHAFHGALFQDRETGIISAELVLILHNPESTAPLSTDADVLLATVTESSSNEDCLIWDLVNAPPAK